MRPTAFWARDLTQLRTDHGMVHASIIIDVYSRLIVCIRVSNTPGTELCLITLAEACSRFGRPEVFHSDKEAQYTSRIFRVDLRRRSIKQSMKGNRGWKDNVFAE